VKEVGLGVTLHTKSDPAAATALRTALSVPEGKVAFGYIDFATAPGADEAGLGELAGIIETILGTLGGGLNEKAGIPVYHSSSCTLVKDKDGASVLRATFIADVNPVEMAAALTGQDPSLFNSSGLLDLRVAFETPLTLALLRDPAFTLSPERIRARFSIDGSVNSGIDARINSLTTVVGPRKKAKAAIATAAAAAAFFKGLNIDIQTIGLDAFAAKFEGMNKGIGRKITEVATQAGGMPLNALLGPLALNLRAQGTAMASAAEMRPLFDSFFRNIAGPKRIHIQLDTEEIGLSFTGLDVVALINALASPEQIAALGM